MIPQDLEFEIYNSNGTTTGAELVKELITYCLDVMDSPPDEPEALGHFITRKYVFGIFYCGWPTFTYQEKEIIYIKYKDSEPKEKLTWTILLVLGIVKHLNSLLANVGDYI